MIAAMLLRCDECGRRVPTLVGLGKAAQAPPRCASCAEATPMGATWG